MSVFKEASIKTGIPRGIIEKTYKAYWKVIREHLSSLPLKEDMSEEEFRSLQPSVNMPSIGKLYVTYERQRALRRGYENHINK